MSFRILGLDPAPFAPLFGLDEQALASQGARRQVSTVQPGVPDRVTLTDLPPGEVALLVNYLHQPADSPYRASHAIYVREGGGPVFNAVDEVPPALRVRLLSLRAFDEAGMMLDGDVVEGREVEPVIARMLDNPAVSYLHAHFAKRGCYAARIERA